MALATGIESPLLAKLKQAQKALEKPHQKNELKATAALQSFCRSVEARRDKGVAGEQADTLISAAQEILNLLSDT
jgi:hypothetical protein